MTKLPTALAALAMGTAALAPAASAQRYDQGYYGQGYYGENHGAAYRSAYRDGYNRPQQYYSDDRDNRYQYRRCNNGSTGTIVGAIAGGLLGNSIAGRGDRFLGTVLGGGAGALAGRAIEKSGNGGYCR